MLQFQHTDMHTQLSLHKIGEHSFESIHRFHSILLQWQLEGKGSRDVYIDQSAGSMVMKYPPVPMVKCAMKSIYTGN